MTTTNTEDLTKLEVKQATVLLGCEYEITGYMTEPDRRFYAPVEEIGTILKLDKTLPCAVSHYWEDYLTVDGVLKAVINEHFLLTCILKLGGIYDAGSKASITAMLKEFSLSDRVQILSGFCSDDSKPSLIKQMLGMNITHEFRKAFKTEWSNPPLREYQ